ncbi:MAG: hypothetical protein FWC79_05765 [Oscillospiraceae bacterium]|nr:hypothetical protein [Oscillospiraceae bacterium]
MKRRVLIVSGTTVFLLFFLFGIMASDNSLQNTVMTSGTANLCNKKVHWGMRRGVER